MLLELRRIEQNRLCASTLLEQRTDAKKCFEQKRKSPVVF